MGSDVPEKHDELLNDLAETRRSNGEIVATNVSIGRRTEGGRMDVLAAQPSWTNYNPTCYEVKARREDFLDDTRKGKYRQYMDWVRRLYFAAPAGMLSRDEVPEGCGLLVRSDKGWSGVVAPRVLDLSTEQLELVSRSLLLNLIGAPWRRSPPGRAERIRRMQRAKDIRMEAHRLSERVGRALKASRDMEKLYKWAVRRVLRALGRDEEAQVPEFGPRGGFGGGELESGHDLPELVDELLDQEVPTRRATDALEAAGHALRRAKGSLSSGKNRTEDALEVVEEVRAELKEEG